MEEAEELHIGNRNLPDISRATGLVATYRTYVPAATIPIQICPPTHAPTHPPPTHHPQGSAHHAAHRPGTICHRVRCKRGAADGPAGHTYCSHACTAFPSGERLHFQRAAKSDDRPTNQPPIHPPHHTAVGSPNYTLSWPPHGCPNQPSNQPTNQPTNTHSKAMSQAPSSPTGGPAKPPKSPTTNISLSPTMVEAPVVQSMDTGVAIWGKSSRLPTHPLHPPTHPHPCRNGPRWGLRPPHGAVEGRLVRLF